MNKELSSPVYFRNLDAIRFIAAVMVLFGHTIRPIYISLGVDSGILFLFLEAVCNGELGVSVFFVLSGFLITYLLLKEQQITGKINLRNFYIRRVLRIWPLYFLVVFFTFGFYPLIKTVLDVNNPLASKFAMHLVFLSNFDIIRVQKFFTGCDALSQNITWSVSIEEQFYLFWPLLFVLLPRRFWSTFIGLVVVLSLCFRLINHNDKIVMYYHTLSVLVDLGIGGLAAFLAMYSSQLRYFFGSSGTKKLAAIMVIMFCIVFISPWLFKFPFAEALTRILIAISFALFILSQALTTVDSRLQLHHWRFADKWGKFTYGIYLIHPIVITLTTAALKVFGSLSETLLPILVVLITLPSTFVLSYFSYHYFESWFLQLKHRFEVVHTPS